MFGPFRLDSAERLLWRDDEPLTLPPKVFDILLVLVENSGRLLTKEQLMRAIWPDTFVEENNLAVNISALRKLFGTDHYIETVPKAGYRFVAEVRKLTGEGENRAGGSAALPPQADEAAVSTATTAWSERLKTPIFRPAGSVVLLVTSVLLAASVSFVLYLRSSSAPAPSPRVDSLVVLPLENLSGDSAQDYFADGVTDALIGELAKIGALRVISRTSAMSYKTARKPLPEIGRELGVDAVIEGTIVLSGDRVRIRVQLIEAATDDHLWVESYDRDVADILNLQSEIAGRRP